MQKAAGIWMNHKQAYVIENCDGQETLAIIPSLARPSSTSGLQNYFKNLVNELTGAQDVFICGPGDVKNHFAKFLTQKHNHNLLNVELDQVLSHPTLNQLRAKTSQYIPKTEIAC